MNACRGGDLSCLQLLLDNKADLNVGLDALYYAIRARTDIQGMGFSVLCCNTDAKNVEIYEEEDYVEEDHEEEECAVTAVVVAACIEEYKHVQAYIDEYHRALKKTLSDEVEVDVRMGLGMMGIYQEPLERVLEYLGMSMHKDQVVNASIDGEGTKRALLPFHVLNAEMWLGLHIKEQQRAQLRAEQSMHQAKASMHQDKVNALQTKIDAVFA
jgi:hypothetical protein